jgi:hypothetical protein
MNHLIKCVLTITLGLTISATFAKEPKAAIQNGSLTQIKAVEGRSVFYLPSNTTDNLKLEINNQLNSKNYYIGYLLSTRLIDRLEKSKEESPENIAYYHFMNVVAMLNHHISNNRPITKARAKRISPPFISSNLQKAKQLAPTNKTYQVDIDEEKLKRFLRVAYKYHELQQKNKLPCAILVNGTPPELCVILPRTSPLGAQTNTVRGLKY